MTDTTNQPINTVAFQDAVTRLRRARQMQLALEPLKLLLSDVEEEVRQAAIAADDAGMSQRAIAAQTGVAQPTVKQMLDGRRGAPTPPPSVAEQAWALHLSATAVGTLTKRLLGQDVPSRSPRDGYISPREGVVRAIESLDNTAGVLAKTAAALETRDRVDSSR